MCATSHLLQVTRLLESVNGAVDGRLIEVLADGHHAHLYTDPDIPSIGRGTQASKRRFQRYRGVIERDFDP
jgi:hypothetical protein